MIAFSRREVRLVPLIAFIGGKLNILLGHKGSSGGIMTKGLVIQWMVNAQDLRNFQQTLFACLLGRHHMLVLALPLITD